MTQPQPNPMGVPPEGYDAPAAPSPYQSQQFPAGTQAQPPMPTPNQAFGYPPAPQQHQSQPQPPMPNQAYGSPQPPMPNQAYGYPPAPQQHQSQPPMPNQAYGYPQAKSKIVAGLLGIFLGPLGIHRFYLGYTKIAVIQLILTLVLGSVGLGVVGLWGVIEGIMILVGSAQFRADARGVRLRD